MWVCGVWRRFRTRGKEREREAAGRGECGGDAARRGVREVAWGRIDMITTSNEDGSRSR